MTLAEKIARFAHDLSYDQLTNEAVHEAKRRLIDTLGCGMGAWAAEPVQIARQVATMATSDLGATVLGTSHRSSMELGAFANGTAFRYLDYNDTYLSKEPAHPSDNIAALLAIADGLELSGEDLILGIVVAYQVQCALCDAFSIRARGWDHVTYGAFSTVAGIAAMLEWPTTKTVHALGLAATPNVAMRLTRAGELSMWKGCAFANASRNGVFAALLAHLGMSGPAPAFEGDMGFFQQVSGGEAFDLELEPSDGVFAINRSYIKKYPAEYHSQSAIDAALELRQRLGRPIAPGEIAKLEIATFTASYEIIGAEPEKWRPQARETADHSLPYITVVALVDGQIEPASFAEERFRDEELLSAVAKTTVVPDPELDPLYPAGGIPNRLRLELTDGWKGEARVDAPRGHALNPMNDDEVEAKFRAQCQALMRPRRIDEALASLRAIDEMGTAGQVLESFAL